MVLMAELRVVSAMLVAAGVLAAGTGMTARPAVAGEAGQAATGGTQKPKEPAPEYDAKFVRMEIPRKVTTDQVFKVVIVMRNTGARSWGPDNDAHGLLRSQDPPNNTTWGTNFIIQRQGTNCKVGQEFAYTSYLRAPHAPGTYGFQWRLTQRKHGTFFGEPTAREVIQVEQRPEQPPPPLPARDPAAKQVLSYEDFEYVGSFKVPGRVGGGRGGYSESGLALRKMKDGTKRLFVNFTHPAQALFEVEIPALVKLEKGNQADLKVAPLKKVWGAIQMKGKAGDKEITICPNGDFWWAPGSNSLYWTYYYYYWATGELLPTLGVSKLDDDGTMTHSGPWKVPTGHFKAYWRGVTRLSKEFADKYTGGRTLALGFGGVYCICGSASRGPALCAIAEPDPAKDTVDMVEMLAYAGPAKAPRDGNYFSNVGYWSDQPDSPAKGYWAPTDAVPTAVFIDLPQKHAYIAFAHLGTGRMGYDYGGVTRGGSVSCWYSYDPRDLGEAARGSRKIGEVMPRSRTNVVLPGGRGIVVGSCFDEADRRLYLYCRGALPGGMESQPCVHVYRVKQAEGQAGDARDARDGSSRWTAAMFDGVARR